MTTWQFSENSIFTGKGKLTANKVGRELDRVTKANDGALTTKSVVAASRSEKAVLHDCFEWDDSIAAERHREEQARAIITSIRVVVEPGARPGPAYISIAANPETNEPRSYRPLSVVLSSPTLRAQMLRDAERDLRAFELRYAELIEVVEFIAQARAVVAKLTRKETQPTA